MLRDHLVSAAYNIGWKFKTTHAVTFPKSYSSGYHRLRHFEHLNRSRGYNLSFFFFCATSQKENIYLPDSNFSWQEVGWVSSLSVMAFPNVLDHCFLLKQNTTQHHSTQHDTPYVLMASTPSRLLSLTALHVLEEVFSFVLFCFLFFPLSLEPTTCIIIL